MNSMLNDSKEAFKILEKEYNIPPDVIGDPGTLSKLEEKNFGKHEKKCFTLLKDYVQFSELWLRYVENDELEELCSTLKKKSDLDILDNDFKNDYYTIETTFKLLDVYKESMLFRLLRSFQLNRNRSQKTPDHPDGVAKGLILMIERNINAWNMLRDYFPKTEDKIFRILIILKKLSKEITIIFPRNENFILPGFDDLESNQ
jgi:hypothetical protein